MFEFCWTNLVLMIEKVAFLALNAQIDRGLRTINFPLLLKVWSLNSSLESVFYCFQAIIRHEIRFSTELTNLKRWPSFLLLLEKYNENLFLKEALLSSK